MKVIFLLIALISLAIIGIRNMSQRFQAGGNVRGVKKNPLKAQKLAEQLNAIYGKIEIALYPDLFKRILAFPENSRLDKYKLLYSTSISSNELLLLTECNEADFVESMHGNVKDVKRLHFSAFALRMNADKTHYEVYSNIYEDLNEKNLKTDFVNELVLLSALSKLTSPIENAPEQRSSSIDKAMEQLK